VFQEEEVLQVLFTMDGDKVPSLDDSLLLFFGHARL